MSSSSESHASMVRVPAILFLIITPIFISLRFWSRAKLNATLGPDDWTILASFFCCITVAILMLVSCDYGFGRHIYSIAPADKAMALKLFYVAQIFYKITINLTKSSILLLYLRLFPQRYFRIAAYTLLAIILAYMIATCASSIWQCNPVERAWNKTIPGTCISLTKNWYANAGFSIATDILIILMPQRVIWQLQVPMRQRVAIMGIFALGLFVTITSILRMTTLNFSTKSPDTTYDIASTLWTLIEDNVAIICACLPTCRPVLAYLFPRVFGYTEVSHSGYGSSGRRTNGSNTHHSNKDAWTVEAGKHPNLSRTHTRLDSSDGRSDEFILNTMSAKEAMDLEIPESVVRTTSSFGVTYDDGNNRI